MIILELELIYKSDSPFVISIKSMLNILQKISFAISFSKNVLVMDAGPMDILINDFPQECLEKDVSARIGKHYLSVSQQSSDEILKQTVYRGVIMGKMRRLFISIPTKHPIVNVYHNVHYLLDTGSPITTLIRKALCALHQREYNADTKNHRQFLIDKPYQIGSQKVQIQCSNPDKESEYRSYHNVNLLGMDFLEQFKQVILNNNFQDRQFVLELSKIKSQNWDKKII